MYLSGMGADAIAADLQEHKVKNCTAYWQERGVARSGRKSDEGPYRWHPSTVKKILSNQHYCGDVINFKSHAASFKNKKRIPNPPEMQMVFKDVHEPIIDRETFEIVQTLLKTTKHIPTKKSNGEKSIYSDLVFCADCGKKLWYHTNPRNKNIHFFACSNYVKDYGGTCQSRHYVRAEALDSVVKMELGRLADFLRDDEEMFANLLAEKSNNEREAERKRLESELAKAIARSEQVNTLYEAVYEDNASGKVDDEWFIHLTSKYTAERADLRQKKAELQERLKKLDEENKDVDTFIRAIRKFMEMDTLTPALLHRLIDRIEIHEREGSGKETIQRIDICYKFVGYVSLQELMPTASYDADLRQGVGIKYITEPITA